MKVLRGATYSPDRWSIGGLQALLRTETDRIGLWLDSTLLSAEQTVETILTRLDASRVRLPCPVDWSQANKHQPARNVGLRDRIGGTALKLEEQQGAPDVAPPPPPRARAPGALPPSA
jgi:hypothetical protein